MVSFLNDEFMALLGSVPDRIRVASLMILSIDDLESLESSVGQFSLMEAIAEYDRQCPDRAVDFHTFLAHSRFADSIRPSQHVMEAADMQRQETISALFTLP